MGRTNCLSFPLSLPPFPSLLLSLFSLHHPISLWCPSILLFSFYVPYKYLHLVLHDRWPTRKYVSGFFLFSNSLFSCHFFWLLLIPPTPTPFCLSFTLLWWYTEWKHHFFFIFSFHLCTFSPWHLFLWKLVRKQLLQAAICGYMPHIRTTNTNKQRKDKGDIQINNSNSI